MIYTIGKKSCYNFLPPGVKKLGKTENYNGQPYTGGICFETLEKAQAYILDYPEYGVYGLDCTWENTYHQDGENFLILDTDIIKITEDKNEHCS